jgi:hypothetical protein
MWFFIHEPEDSPEVDIYSKRPKWVLLPGVTYLVGRADDEDKMVKKADIYLTNHDPTFSRRHAKITVVKKENSVQSEVVVEDLDSSHGTRIDQHIDNPAVGIENFIRDGSTNCITEPVTLKDKSRIGFGHTTFRLLWIQLEVITSMLKDVNELTAILKTMARTKVQPKWTKRTTHLVMTQIMISPKVLMCLLGQVPIVTPAYFKDLYSAAKTKQRVPDPDNYIPPVAQNESQLKGANINLGRDPSRQTFFKGKEFIILDKIAELEEILPMTSAKITHFDPDNNEGYTDARLDSDDVIVVKPKRSSSGASQEASALLHSYLNSIHRVMVSSTSIYLAIVKNDVRVCSNTKQKLNTSLISHNSSNLMQNTDQFSIRAKETLDVTVKETPSANITAKEKQAINSTNQRNEAMMPPATIRTESTNRKPEITRSNASMISSTNRNLESIIPSTNRLSEVSQARSTVSMIPPTNRNLESILPSTDRHTETNQAKDTSTMIPSTIRNVETNLTDTSSMIPPTNRRTESMFPESKISSELVQKKRPLSSDSDTENQENKKPNLNSANFASQKKVGASPDDAEDLFGFGDDVDDDQLVEAVLQVESKSNKQNTQKKDDQGTGTSSRKRKASCSDDQEEDIFGFNQEDEDEEIAISDNKRLKESGSLGNKTQHQEVKSSSNKAFKPEVTPATPSGHFSPVKHSNTKQLNRTGNETKFNPSASSSLIDTTGYLSKNKMKAEVDDEMSHLEESFCTVVVSHNITRSPLQLTARSRFEDEMGDVSTGNNFSNTTLPQSQGRKVFYKQNIRRITNKVALTKSLIGDEEDNSIAEWLIKNPVVANTLQQQEAEEQKGDELWQFAEAEQSQKRNRQQQMFTSRPRR